MADPIAFRPDKDALCQEAAAAVRRLLLGAEPDRSFARAVRVTREVATFGGVVWPED